MELENHHLVTNIVKSGWGKNHQRLNIRAERTHFDEVQGICMSTCLLAENFLVTRERSNYTVE